jgi:hypothetical protein
MRKNHSPLNSNGHFALVYIKLKEYVASLTIDKSGNLYPKHQMSSSVFNIPHWY